MRSAMIAALALCIGLMQSSWAGPVDQSTDVTNATTLKGVTIHSTPFVLYVDGKFLGYSVQLLKYIAKEVGFKYELYLSPDGKYGTSTPDGAWNGMIGEVITGKADFALADLTVTESRSKVVDFTMPYHDLSLAALVHMNHSSGLSSLQDLAQQSNGPVVSMLANGATREFLAHSQHETAKRLLRKVEASGTKSVVPSMEAGYERVRNGEPLALVGESSVLRYWAGNLATLRLLPDEQNLFARYYAIALAKNSTLLHRFNAAITKWRDNQAKLDAEPYWRAPGDM